MLKAKSPCSLIYHQNNEKQNHKIFQAKRNPQDFVYQPPAQSRTNQIRSLVQQSTYLYLSSRALSIFRGGDFKISVSKLFQYFLIHMVKKKDKAKKNPKPQTQTTLYPLSLLQANQQTLFSQPLLICQVLQPPDYLGGFPVELTLGYQNLQQKVLQNVAIQIEK